MRVIVTNNKKVESKLSDKAEIKMLKNSSGLSVLKEARKMAESGGRLLVDPTRSKGYYKSLPFFIDESNKSSDEKGLQLLDRCIEQAMKAGESDGISKEPLLSGILQNKDLDIVQKIIG